MWTHRGRKTWKGGHSPRNKRIQKRLYYTAVQETNASPPLCEGVCLNNSPSTIPVLAQSTITVLAQYQFLREAQYQSWHNVSPGTISVLAQSTISVLAQYQFLRKAQYQSWHNISPGTMSVLAQSAKHYISPCM
jgi:hypothetical protein